jgi:hypothetical protein
MNLPASFPLKKGSRYLNDKTIASKLKPFMHQKRALQFILFMCGASCRKKIDYLQAS